MRAASVIAALFVVAPVLSAQPSAARTVAFGPTKSDILGDWERHKANVITYIDAMPDSAMTFMPTPGVRTFAQQIDHIVGTHAEVAASALRGAKGLPVARDTAQIFHNKAALRAYATAAFDYAIASIRDANDATLTKSSTLFGQPAAPAWRWLQLSLEHGAWTLGATVPYLRLNKVTPPEYKLPF